MFLPNNHPREDSNPKVERDSVSENSIVTTFEQNLKDNTRRESLEHSAPSAIGMFFNF